MAITLTSDPIIALADVRDLISEASKTEAQLMINAVSAKFLRFTNRARITNGSATEWAKGGSKKIWLHAATPTVVTVTTYRDGVLDDTWTSADNEVRIVDGLTDSYIELLEGTPPLYEGLDTVKIAYTGGWSTVPGDIVLAALDQMRVERDRRQGNLGAVSISQDGQAVKLEISGLIKSVQDAFKPYRVEV